MRIPCGNGIPRPGKLGVFVLADANGNGTLDTDELQDLLKQANIDASNKQFAVISQVVNRSGLGEMKFEEFVAVFSGASKLLSNFRTEVKP